MVDWILEFWRDQSRIDWTNILGQNITAVGAHGELFISWLTRKEEEEEDEDDNKDDGGGIDKGQQRH